MEIDVQQFYGLAGAPLVVALVQVIKAGLPTLDSRWWPGVTLVVAIGWNVGLAAILMQNLGIAAVMGVVTGLLASGLYSHATTVAGK